MVFLEFGVCRVTITLAGTSDGQSGVDVVKRERGKRQSRSNSSDEDIFFVVEYRRRERCERLTLVSSVFGPEVVTVEFYQFVSELGSQTEKKIPKQIGSHIAQKQI